MIARIVLISLALGLASSAQATPPATPVSDPNSPDLELPLASDLLANKPIAGTWTLNGDASITGARFKSPNYPDTLTIGCDNGPGRAFLNWTVKDKAVDGVVRVYTAAKTVEFNATATNFVEHVLTVDVDGEDPRWAVLKVKQNRFAVQGFGQSIVVPWDAKIGEALAECESPPSNGAAPK